jgi:hypothetical protein
MVQAWTVLLQVLPLLFIVAVIGTAYYCYARHIPLDDPPSDSCLPEYHLELPRYVTEETLHLPPSYDSVVDPLEGERIGSSSTEHLVADIESENPSQESVAVPIESNVEGITQPELVHNQQ